MALQSITQARAINQAFAGSITTNGTNIPAALVEDISSSVFQVNKTRPEAIIQGIVAATLKGNPANAQLFQALVRSTLLDEPSITNVLRAQTADTDQARFASRFNMDTNHKQLFRMFLNDISQSLQQPKVETIKTPRFGAASS